MRLRGSVHILMTESTSKKDFKNLEWKVKYNKMRVIEHKMKYCSWTQVLSSQVPDTYGALGLKTVRGI